jgi:hypothetical protein
MQVANFVCRFDGQTQYWNYAKRQTLMPQHFMAEIIARLPTFPGMTRFTTSCIAAFHP